MTKENEGKKPSKKQYPTFEWTEFTPDTMWNKQRGGALDAAAPKPYKKSSYSSQRDHSEFSRVPGQAGNVVLRERASSLGSNAEAASPKKDQGAPSAAPASSKVAAEKPVNRRSAEYRRNLAAASAPAQPARTIAATSEAAGQSAGYALATNARVGLDGRRARLFALITVLVLIAGVASWWFLWRSVDVTVNGAAEHARVGASVDSFVSANKNFGAKPGRMLSVSGNVISEDGGNAYSVSIDGSELSHEEAQERKLQGGESLTVGDGGDATEPHSSKIVEKAPGIQMEAGGAIQYVRQWGKPGKEEMWTGETSGEVVSHGVTEETQDMIVASRTPQPQGDGMYMALTFDDGPSQYTQEILDILAEKGATATFFNLGGNANTYPSLSAAVLAGGNELASHTMQHQNLPSLDRDALRNEITTAFDALEGASGQRTQMIRAPYGAFTEIEWVRSGDLISCNVLWNIDTLDWKLPGAEAIKSNVLSGARNGRIVLMHDGGGNRSQDVEALPGIIDGLREQGYELVTVSKLMELDGTFPQEVIDGTVSLPKGCVMPSA